MSRFHRFVFYGLCTLNRSEAWTLSRAGRAGNLRIALRESEHGTQIPLHVLRALRLVVYSDLAVALPHHGGRMHLHRVVEMRAQVIIGLELEGRRVEGLLGVAA